ncbi:4269_t:CDS:2, partial [Gigaspora margarita]
NVINNPDLCYENVAHFKRLLDTLHYKSPILAITDCTKVKSELQFSSSLGCIVGLTLNQNDCIIKTYDDIYDKVSNIKQKNAISKYVRVYALQVPFLKFLSIIVALIPNGNDNSKKIFALYQKLIKIAANLELHIISIGSDSAAAKFQAQNLLQSSLWEH